MLSTIRPKNYPFYWEGLIHRAHLFRARLQPIISGFSVYKQGKFTDVFDTGRFAYDSIPVYGARSQAIWFLQCRTASTSHRKQQYLPKMIEIMVLSLFSLRYWAQH